MTSYLDWQVGDRVVCHRDPRPTFKKWNPVGFAKPEVGKVYTLREIFAETRFRNSRGAVYVRLAEIVNQPVDTFVGLYEPAFAASLFRKVQPRKTSIAIFKAMLAPKEVEPA